MMDPRPDWFLPPISPAAPGPLYQQIVDGLKREIGAGRLAPNQPLPSFRTLAADLLVSVITVKRAYEDLEKEGIIYRRQGLGTFVADGGHSLSREAKRTEAAQHLSDAVRAAREAGLSDPEISAMLQTILQPKPE